MIKEILLNNFKCFEKLDLSFQNVNVFTGMNGMGKSTVIQSLLLLRQSYFENKDMSQLVLNGKYVELGNGQDILYEKASDETIVFSYKDERNDITFNYDYNAEADRLSLNRKAIKSGELDVASEKFMYLSADRIEPRDVYSILNEDELRKREFGNNGEFSIQYLGLYNDDVILPSVILMDKGGESLINQTRLWMNRISPGVFPKVTINKQLRTAEVYYEFIEGRNKTNSYKSKNVGFGITYVLPIIVAILSSKPGDIIVIENPEAHIHPAGQRMLGELIALAGNDGVQLIVETHSDHVLNGIRVAVKQKKIDNNKVAIMFFDRDSKNYEHQMHRIKVDEEGRLDNWPEGFFDEWDNALMELL